MRRNLKKPEDYIGKEILVRGRTIKIDRLEAISGQNYVFHAVDVNDGSEWVFKKSKNPDEWLKPEERAKKARLRESIKAIRAAGAADDFQRALELCERAASESSQEPYLNDALHRLYVLYAHALHYLNRPDEAEAATDTGLQYDSTDPRLLTLKAQYLELRGHLEEALEYYQFAITSIRTPTHLMWGFLSDTETRRFYLKEASLGSASLLAKLAKPHEAKEVLSAFLKEYPTDSTAKDALQKLG